MSCLIFNFLVLKGQEGIAVVQLYHTWYPLDVLVAGSQQAENPSREVIQMGASVPLSKEPPISKTLCFFLVPSVMTWVLSCTFLTRSPLSGSKHQSISLTAESTSAWQLPATAWSGALKDHRVGHTAAPKIPLTYLGPSGDLQIPEAEWQEWLEGIAQSAGCRRTTAPKIALRSVSGLQFFLVMLSFMVKIRFMTSVHGFKATEVHRPHSAPITCFGFFFLGSKILCFSLFFFHPSCADWQVVATLTIFCYCDRAYVITLKAFHSFHCLPRDRTGGHYLED